MSVSPAQPLPLLMNPKAGSLFRSGLDAWLKAHAEGLRIIPTKSADDLTEQCRSLADAGEPVVLAAGGDGTLMRAAQGLIGTDTALGIFPCGTMNVFAREMGIGSRNFDLALKAAQGDARQMVDIFTVNDKPFLQLAGFGPDATVVKLVTPWMKKHLGAASHAVTATRVLARKLPVISVHLPNGETVQGKQVIFGNGARYGGEGHLFSEAPYDDGMLDAAVFGMDSIGILGEIVSSMLQGGINERNLTDATRLYRMEGCTITSDADIDYELDGDYEGTVHPGEAAVIERLPQQLKVCIPE